MGKRLRRGRTCGDSALSRARSTAVVCAVAQGAGVGTGRTGIWGASQAVKFARFDAVTTDIVEIVIGAVVIPVGNDVESERLAGVIRAVRQA